MAFVRFVMASSEKKAKKERKAKREKKAKKETRASGGASEKPPPPPTPPGKARRKAHLIAWFSGLLASDDAPSTRQKFLAARDYVAVANVVRGAARELTGDARGAHDEALRLLDNKGNFLHIVDTCVGALAPGTEPAKLCGEKWAKVKQHHRAKFEKLGGAEGVAAKKRAAREARAEYKLQQEARAEREAKLKTLAAKRKEYRAKMDECRLKGACLDWCNVGTCTFGDECQFEHQPELKGSLVALAAESNAEHVGGKQTAERREEAERRKARKAALKKRADGNKDTVANGILPDFSDSESSDDESNARRTQPPASARRSKVLSVLPGEDGSDEESEDDADVPKIVRLERRRRREEERAAKAAKEKRRAERETREKERRKSAADEKKRRRVEAAGRGVSGGRGGEVLSRAGGGRGGKSPRGGFLAGAKRPRDEHGGDRDRSTGRDRSTEPFDRDRPKKKKPRHPDGRHARNAAATAAGKGRARTKFD